MAFTDDFTGAENTDLSARSGWTLVTDGRDAKINASNQLKMGSGTPSNDSCYACTDQGSANHYTQVDYYSTASNIGSFICVRMTDEDNFIGFRYYNTGWQVYKFVTGTPTQLGSTYVTALTPGDTVKLEADGNSITLYLNGTPVIGPETESFNNTETGQGIVVRDTVSSDPFLDNFEASTLVATAIIDSIDSPVTDGEQDNAFTYSDFASGAPDSITIETAGSEFSIDVSSGMTAAGGSGTWDMPDVSAYTTATAGIPFDTASWGSKIFTLSNGTESDTETVVVNPKTNWHVRELSSPLTTIGHLFYVAGGWNLAAPANADQVYFYSTETVDTEAADYFNIDAAGLITTNLTSETVSGQFFDQTDGKWWPFTVQLGNLLKSRRKMLGGMGTLMR